MNSEFRVGLTPQGVRSLTQAGHHVYLQKGAGLGSGIPDEDYITAGATMLYLLEDIYEQAEMIVKVKQPLPQEFPLLRENHILFTYLHLAPSPDLATALLDSGCAGVAYETIELADGTLPLLAPMSEVAGRIAPQAGAHYLEKAQGGSGVLLGGVPGVERGRVTILGGGIVGANAAKIAAGLGAVVHVLDTNQRRLAYLDDIFRSAITTVISNQESIARLVAFSDLVIGAVLLPGAKTPTLVSRDMIAAMSPGSVIVDVSIDQGGCFETSQPTTHEDPVFMVDNVIHYCVANMPGVVGRTSTMALTNLTLPYIMEIANKGLKRAVRENSSLAKGVNVCRGCITHACVAEAMDSPFEAIERLLH